MSVLALLVIGVATTSPAAATSPACQFAADGWCNEQTSCVTGLSRKGCNGPLYARYDSCDQHSNATHCPRAQKEWRCYDISSLTSDANHSHFLGNSSCYCSRGPEIQLVIQKCEAPPDPIPTPPTPPPHPTPKNVSHIVLVVVDDLGMLYGHQSGIE